jgi:hypothetical protein
VTWNSFTALEGNGQVWTFVDSMSAPSRYYRLKVILPDNGVVYSVNIVGYMWRIMQTGTNLVANPFYTSSGNSISNIFPNCPEGSEIYKVYPGGSYDWSVFFDGVWFTDMWDPSNLTLSPGEGAIFLNPSYAPFYVAFGGEVPQGTLTNWIPAGLSLISSKAHVSGLLNFPAQEGDTIRTWNATNRAYITNTYSGGAWDIPPAIRPGEAFWVKASTPTNWVQNFTADSPGVEPPFIYRDPASRTNNLATTATFTVAATGTGPLGYQWRKDGTNLLNSGRISGANAYTLVISNCQPSDAAPYSVTITNASGSTTSAVVTLTVVSLDSDGDGMPDAW